MEILSDGSVRGETFSGPNYKGEYPVPRHGKETYREFYNRIQSYIKLGYHLGDLSQGSYVIYCLGSPAGGGDCIQDEIIE